MLDHELQPRTPFNQIPASASHGDGVIVIDRDGIGIAILLGRGPEFTALAKRLSASFGLELPTASRRTSNGDVAIVAIGPATWLVTHEYEGNALPATLRESLGDLASIVDQTDGYAVLRLSGPRLYDTLAKLIPLDLHPQAFTPHAAASTVVAHIGVTLWRLTDATDGAPVFEIAVPRSFAVNFWHELIDSAAEYGMRVST